MTINIDKTDVCNATLNGIVDHECIDYWAHVMRPRNYVWGDERPIKIIESDEEEDNPIKATITKELIDKTLKKIILGNHDMQDRLFCQFALAYKHNDGGQIDDIAADAIVQIALFGEIKYA